MIRKRYVVSGMTCPNCAMRIESLEDRLAGVKEIVASYRRGQITIEFDEARISEQEITAAIVRLGYSVSSAGS